MVVLVVHGEAVIRASLRSYVERAGHRVLEARNETEALTTLTGGGTVDMAILDIRTLGPSGADVLERIHRSWPLVTLVVVPRSDQPEPDPSDHPKSTYILRRPFEQHLPQLLQEAVRPPEDPRPTPVTFSSEEAAQIRAQFKTPGLKRLLCPNCGGEMHGGTPMVGGSMALVWEVSCSSCHRSLVFSEIR